MNIQGKNQIVRELIAKSEEESNTFRILALFAIAWSWYTTRSPEQQSRIVDIVIGIPVLVMGCILFFFACFL